MVAAPTTKEGSALRSATPSAASRWMAALLDTTPGSPQRSVEELQSRCRSALQGSSLPSRREEAWRFTDPSLLTTITPALLSPRPGAATLAAAGGAALGSGVRLFCDGQHDPLDGVSLPSGLEPIPSSELQAWLSRTLEATGCDQHWGILLNGALLRHVLALRVRGSVAPLLEIHSDAAAAQGILPLRILLVLEDGAELDLLQVHQASGASLTNVVLEAHLSPGSRLRHSLVATGSDTGALHAHLAFRQSPRSELHHTCAGLGWGFARYEPRLIQSEGAATSVLRGLQLVQHQQLADTHSHVHFGGPEGSLDQLHKAVADHSAHSVFNGAVRVPQPAQQTDAAQMSRNLLLSERARIDTKPELEIVADDVQCAHGATVSRLEQEELFYLRSRGIASDQATRLLLRGFCDEVLSQLPPQAMAFCPTQQWLTSLEPGQ